MIYRPQWIGSASSLLIVHPSLYRRFCRDLMERQVYSGQTRYRSPYLRAGLAANLRDSENYLGIGGEVSGHALTNPQGVGSMPSNSKYGTDYHSVLIIAEKYKLPEPASAKA